MKVYIQLKGEPFSRVYENVTAVYGKNGAKVIIHDFEGVKGKEETIIIDLIKKWEVESE